MSELKPCPFCGSKDADLFIDDGRHWNVCLQCRATGPVCSKYDGEEDDTSLDWNNRPTEREAAERMRERCVRMAYDCYMECDTGSGCLAAAIIERVVRHLPLEGDD